MAKTFEVAVDETGPTYYELPGSQASIDRNAADLEDPVFGQTFMSSQTGLISWSANASAFYKGFAGYVANILQAGTPTAMAAQAMTDLTGNKFRVTDLTKSVLEKNGTFILYSGETGTPVIPAGEIDYIDYLHGEVQFNVPQQVPVTIDGNYLPLAQLGKAQSFTLGQTAEVENITDLATAQANNGHAVFQVRTLRASLELGQFWGSLTTLKDLVADRSELVIEIAPDGNRKSYARGYFKALTAGGSGDFGGVENESLTFGLSVPGDLVTPPFSWRHASDTTLSQAVRILLDAWETKVSVLLRYLPDGTNGESGSVFVTDMSLSGGVEVMNEFSVSLQGSGALADVP